MNFKKNLDAYDKDMNLIGEFDGEFFYSINGGLLSDYRVDGDEIYTRNPNEIQKHIGTFENGKAILFTGELLFQCIE